MFHPLNVVRKNPRTRHILVTAMFLVVSIVFGHHSGAASSPVLRKQTARVRFTSRYLIAVKGSPSQCTLTALIPQTIPDRQEVIALDYSMRPSRVFTQDGNRYAEFSVAKPRNDDVIAITATMALQGRGIGNPGLTAIRDDASLASFLLSEPGIDRDLPVLREAARNLPKGDEIEKLRAIYSFVSGKLSYRGYVSEDVGAAHALEKAYGDCSDFTDVFVSLCRAAGIPARSVDGYLVNYGNDTPRHTWAEAYTRKYGWVPIDILLTYLKKVPFDGLPPEYIYLSRVRNDAVINNYHFFACNFSGGSITVTDHYAVEHLPDAVLQASAR